MDTANVILIAAAALICGAVGAAIAFLSRREPIAGLVAGLLLGPLGWAAIGLLPRRANFLYFDAYGQLLRHPAPPPVSVRERP